MQGEKHPGVLFPGESAAGGEGGVILYCVPGEQDVKATRFQCRLQMLCQTKILGSFVSSFQDRVLVAELSVTGIQYDQLFSHDCYVSFARILRYHYTAFRHCCQVNLLLP